MTINFKDNANGNTSNRDKNKQITHIHIKQLKVLHNESKLILYN